MKRTAMNQSTITPEAYEAEKQACREAMDKLLSRPLNIQSYAKTMHHEAVTKESKTTAYKNTKGRQKFAHAPASRLDLNLFKLLTDREEFRCNEVKSPKLAKRTSLTAEQQAKQREKEIAEFYKGEPLPGLADHVNAKGEPWNYYTLARKAVWGRATEDLRAEHDDVFRENYGDMLMQAISNLYDTERLAKTINRIKGKAEKEGVNLTDKQILIKAYFRVAETGVTHWIEANKATFYRVAVNEQTGEQLTKEEAKEVRKARAAHYADQKYTPEVIDSYEDENGDQVTVYETRTPIDHYRQRVATVNQDERYKASTSFKDTEAMISDGGELELKTALLRLDLASLLESKPNDLKLALELLAGNVSWLDCQKVNYSRRERIRAAFYEAAGIAMEA